MSVDEGFRQSREATERALELEPQLAEAHATLGRIRSAYDWDHSGALAAYQRALELAPGSSVVMDGASVLEFKLGRFDHALRLSRQVLTQDPLSGAVWHNLGLFCYSAGLLAESEKAFQRAMDLAPQRLVTTAMLALVLWNQDRGKEALELAEHEPDEFWRMWALAMLCHLSGETDRSDRVLARILDEHSDGDAFQIAEIYAVRGEPDKALEWLERGVAARDPGVTHMYADPRFRSLRADSRWLELMKKTGLDQLSDHR